MALLSFSESLPIWSIVFKVKALLLPQVLIKFIFDLILDHFPGDGKHLIE